jgi:hypothetical protein
MHFHCFFVDSGKYASKRIGSEPWVSFMNGGSKVPWLPMRREGGIPESMLPSGLEVTRTLGPISERSQ